VFFHFFFVKLGLYHKYIHNTSVSANVFKKLTGIKGEGSAAYIPTDKSGGFTAAFDKHYFFNIASTR